MIKHPSKATFTKTFWALQHGGSRFTIHYRRNITFPIECSNSSGNWCVAPVSISFTVAGNRNNIWPQGLDTRTSPSCEAKTRRAEQLSWRKGIRIAGMLRCEPSTRMDFSLAPNRREVRRPKVRKLIRMKCCILFDSCIFFDMLKRSLNSVWSVSVISSPWRRTFNEEAILDGISLMIAAKCGTLSCRIVPLSSIRLPPLSSNENLKGSPLYYDIEKKRIK